MRKRITRLVVGLSFSLLTAGALRVATTHPGALTPLAGFVTPGYIAVVVVFTLEPIWEALLSGPRNLDRFSDVEGSAGSLAALLAASWTIAAFGEEIAYRIVLMRGISFALGDSGTAKGLALVLQSLMFGLIHAYQGPTGIVSSAMSGLVFGAVTRGG